MNSRDVALFLKLAQPSLLWNRDRQRIEQFDRSDSTFAQAVEHLELVLHLFLAGVEVVHLADHLFQLGNPCLGLVQPGDVSLVLGVDMLIEHVIADHTQDQNPTAEDQKLPTDLSLPALANRQKIDSDQLGHLKPRRFARSALNSACLPPFEPPAPQRPPPSAPARPGMPDQIFA